MKENKKRKKGRKNSKINVILPTTKQTYKSLIKFFIFLTINSIHFHFSLTVQEVSVSLLTESKEIEDEGLMSVEKHQKQSNKKEKKEKYKKLDNLVISFFLTLLQIVQ